MGVRAEVARAPALGAAQHLRAGELLAEGHREVGVGLVVAVLDVEAGVELLDPRVLELERLDLGRDDGPLDPGAVRTIREVRGCSAEMSWKYEESRERRDLALRRR